MSVMAASVLRRSHVIWVAAAQTLPVQAGVFMMRALNWVLGCIGRSYLATTRFGMTMLCDPRDVVQKMILHFGVWEPDITALIAATLRAGDCFVDIGANVGYDSLLAATAVGVSGSVVSIEAVPATFAKLQHNIALNGVTNIRAVNVAVSDVPSRMRIYAPADFNTGMAGSLPGKGRHEICVVDARPLDEILTEAERGRLRLIKMDIEGGEAAVLRRLLDTLELYRPDMELIVELAGEGTASEPLFQAMLDAGFSAFAICNDFTYEFYIRALPRAPLRPLPEMPSRQTDVLFSRTR